MEMHVTYNNVSYFIIKQSNLFNTDTKGTEPSVRFTEVSVLQRQGMYDFWHFWDQTNCPYQRVVRIIEMSLRRGQTVLTNVEFHIINESSQFANKCQKVNKTRNLLKPEKMFILHIVKRANNSQLALVRTYSKTKYYEVFNQENTKPVHIKIRLFPFQE